jgi:hypothetical protein
MISQLSMKYLYYLNRVYKSYQFSFEGVLKYNHLEKDYEYNDMIDLLDSENIKKNQ